MEDLYSIKKNGVPALSDKDFKGKRLTTYLGRPGFIVFYAPWCPHCSNPEFIKMMSGLAKLSSQMKTNRKPVVLSFNSDRYPEMSNKLGIEMFPTIHYVDQKGNMEKYFGGRDHKSMLDFMIMKLEK